MDQARSTRNAVPRGTCWLCGKPTKNPNAKQHKECRELHKSKFAASLPVEPTAVPVAVPPVSAVRFQKQPQQQRSKQQQHASQRVPNPNPLHVEAATFMFTSNDQAITQFMNLKEKKKVLVLRKWSSKTFDATWLSIDMKSTNNSSSSSSSSSSNSYYSYAKQYYGCVPWSVAEDLRLLRVMVVCSGWSMDQEVLQKLLPFRNVTEATARYSFLNVLYESSATYNAAKVAKVAKNLKSKKKNRKKNQQQRTQEMAKWYKEETKTLRNALSR